MSTSTTPDTHHPIVAVVGAGITGSVVAKHLASQGLRVAVHDEREAAAVQLARVVGGVAIEAPTHAGAADVVVLCHPVPHAQMAAHLLDARTPVVSLGDDLGDVDDLMSLHGRAQRAEVPLVVGAAMAPGLSGLLARHLAASVAVLEEVHVAVHGTGGPACARQHHRSLGRTSRAWHDGEWIERLGGSGRELCWFPEPIGAYDCYRADLADPRVLHHVFPEARRITARMSATRRDRLTARLPMLTPPHTGGSVGAVRVEVRGAGPAGERLSVIAGAAGRAATIAGAVATAAVLEVLAGTLDAGVRVAGDDAATSARMLERVQSLGVGLQTFTGVARPSGW